MRRLARHNRKDRPVSRDSSLTSGASWPFRRGYLWCALPSIVLLIGASLAGVTRAMELDKKVREKAIHWLPLQDIGKVVIRSDVPQQDMLAVIRELAERKSHS